MMIEPELRKCTCAEGEFLSLTVFGASSAHSQSDDTSSALGSMSGVNLDVELYVHLLPGYSPDPRHHG